MSWVFETRVVFLSATIYTFDRSANSIIRRIFIMAIGNNFDYCVLLTDFNA